MLGSFCAVCRHNNWEQLITFYLNFQSSALKRTVSEPYELLYSSHQQSVVTETTVTEASSDSRIFVMCCSLEQSSHVVYFFVAKMISKVQYGHHAIVTLVFHNIEGTKIGRYPSCDGGYQLLLTVPSHGVSRNVLLSKSFNNRIFFDGNMFHVSSLVLLSNEAD